MRFNSLQLTNQFVRGVYLSTFENRSWLLLVVLNNLLRMFELSILIPLFCFFWQIFLCLIFLFPIRLLLGILLFLFAGIWCFFTTFGWNPQDLKTPLTPWRRYLQIDCKLPRSFSSSPYCLPCNYYNVRLENLVLDQLIIPILTFLCILNTHLLDIVLIL